MKVLLVTSAGDGELKTVCDALQRQDIEVFRCIPVRDIKEFEIPDPDEGERPVWVAAGGDGTVGAVAGKIAGTGSTMGIVPLGTSNDVARSLGVPLDIEGAVELLVSGERDVLDAGEFTPQEGSARHFMHAAAVGINVQFAQLATRKSFRARLGPLTYVVAGLLAVRRFQPFTCDLEFDGDASTLCLTHLSVVNAPVFGGALGLELPGSRIDDGRLDVLTVEEMSLGRLLLSVVGLLRGTKALPHGIRVEHVRCLQISTDKPMDVTLDGEIAAQAPGTFRVAAEGLRVIVPPGSRDNG